ncbi:MAG: amino acid permease [Candidatus Micrarchaeota archaeon]|nr:amino acid permease [Candidatus Micrarchaeota archaeon]
MRKLVRAAGLFQLVTYGMGNIIGAGIYVLAGVASGLAGNAVWLAFVIGAVVALFTGLSYAELGSTYPKAASEYTYVEKAYKRRPLSFMTEWTMLLTEIVAASAVSIGFARYFQSLTGLPILAVAPALLVVLTIIAITGIKSSLKINTALSIVAIAGLIIVVLAGSAKLGTVDYSYSPTGIQGIMAASILVFFAFIGFDNITNLAEETKRPERLIPRGLLISLLVSTALYILVGIAAVSLVPWQQLSTSEAPLALAASSTLGHGAFILLAVFALLTTFNTALVLLIVGSRIIYGMSRAGVLPEAFGRLNRANAPQNASILILAIAVAFLGLGSISRIAEVTSFGSLLVFALINISLLHLRRIAPEARRPFRAPINIGWFSVTAMLGVISCLVMLSQFNAVSAALGLALPISGLAIYAVANRRKG